MYGRGAEGVVEDQEEYDEDDYESEDDGDVFAFVPRECSMLPQNKSTPLTIARYLSWQLT
jgi:hypothetical protein